MHEIKIIINFPFFMKLKLIFTFSPMWITRSTNYRNSYFFYPLRVSRCMNSAHIHQMVEFLLQFQTRPYKTLQITLECQPDLIYNRESQRLRALFLLNLQRMQTSVKCLLNNYILLRIYIYLRITL